jgi:CheY-like chemotaxis protein
LKTDLILLDFFIPGGRAPEIIRNITNMPNCSRIPIFVMAEREFRLNAPEVYDAGAKAFLPKPLQKHQLLSLIPRFLTPKPEKPRRFAKRADYLVDWDSNLAKF